MIIITIIIAIIINSTKDDIWDMEELFHKLTNVENKVWKNSLAYPIYRLDSALFSVVILFHHWFPLMEKAGIWAFILPRNFPAVLIIFTGRGGARKPPFPAVRGGAGNPPLPAGRDVHPCQRAFYTTNLLMVWQNLLIYKSIFQEFFWKIECSTMLLAEKMKPRSKITLKT